MSDDKPVVDTAEELRSKVIEEYSLDEELQDELIEKLTEERLEAQKKLSKTIEQKAKYRELGVKAGILDPKTFEPIEKQKPEGEQEQKPDDNKSEKEKLKTNGLTREDIQKEIFLSQGGTKEHLEILETLSKIKGVSLTEAQKDPYYVNLLKQEEEQDKKEKAQIDASSGGSKVKKEKPLTKDEHKKMAMEYWNK